MTSTRERKERFITHWGGEIMGVRTGNDAVSCCLRDNGLSLFPDWAIDEMVEETIADIRSRIQRNIRNRAANAAWARRATS